MPICIVECVLTPVEVTAGAIKLLRRLFLMPFSNCFRSIIHPTHALPRSILVALTAGSLMTACGSASFTGGGGGDQTTRVENLQPGPSTAPVGTTRANSPIVPGASQNPTNSTADTVQTINGIINTIRNNIDVTSTDREIIFGGDKVFHIGDGRFPASSCQSQLKAYDLSGTKYSFEFDVVEDGTVVEMDVLTVCGVDYSDSNYLRLVKNGSENLEQERLVAGRLRADLKNMTLQKGRYMIQVESTLNTRVAVEGGDNDDFIVGKVRIRASKKVIAGGVRVE